jgi:hypothetical protein
MLSYRFLISICLFYVIVEIVLHTYCLCVATVNLNSTPQVNPKIKSFFVIFCYQKRKAETFLLALNRNVSE